MPTLTLDRLDFAKYHGTGNDFILIDNLDGKIPQVAYPALAKQLCKLHFGIGSDGLILIDPSSTHDYKFSFVNPDGSIGEMCGNGIRCFAKFLHDRHITTKQTIRCETLAGTIVPEVHDVDGIVESVTVDMGKPILTRKEIPVTGSGSNLNIPITIQGMDLVFTAVSMGNPHAVFFMDEINVHKTLELGPLIEPHEMFPRKINVEFVKVRNPKEIDMLVYERGAGMTLACGTGACASVVAGTLLGKLEKGTPVTVHLQGGDLRVTYRDESVFMDGAATHVFDGTIGSFNIDY